MNDVKNSKQDKRKEYETEFRLKDTEALIEDKQRCHEEIRKKEDENHILAEKLDDMQEKLMRHSYSSHAKKKEIQKEIEMCAGQIHMKNEQIDDLLDRIGVLESIIIERKLSERR